MGSSSIGSKSASKNSKGGKKKRCGICDGCTAKECETCKYCMDKTKRGGSNTLRKPCLLRVCTNPISVKRLKRLKMVKMVKMVKMMGKVLKKRTSPLLAITVL